MEDSIKQRVIQIIRQYKLSVTAFSKQIDIAQPTLNRQITGENAMSLATVESLLKHFPDISAEWLLRGKGEMMVSAQPQQDNPPIRNIGELMVDDEGYLKLKMK